MPVIGDHDRVKENEELGELLQTPGWARLVAYAETAYGPVATAQRLRGAAGEQKDMAAIGVIASQLFAGSEAVGIVLGWPREQITRNERVLASTQAVPR